MDPAHEAYSSPRPTSPPRQNKVHVQRQYREKETEGFSALREVIKDLTGEELQTRQEILRKATELLSAVLRERRQREMRVVPPASQVEMFPVGNFVGSSQSSLWQQTWHPDAEFDVRSDYTTQPHEQQDPTMFNMDPALAHTTYGGEYFNSPGR